MQGSGDSIKSFLKDLNNGPRAAHVVKVEKEEIKIKVCQFWSDFFLSDTKLLRGGTKHGLGGQKAPFSPQTFSQTLALGLKEKY